MKRPSFDNESTYKGFLESGREQEFDELFDSAAESARALFHAKHPIHIGQNELFTEQKLIQRSPVDGSIMGEFQRAGREHARLALEEANSAFEQWRDTEYGERAMIFRKAADLLSKRKFETAAILSYENGKSRYESMGEVDEGIDFMRYYANEIELNRGYIRRSSSHGAKRVASRGFQGAPGAGERVRIALLPYGVFAVIAPFNFPVSISIGMSTGALITGNTVVFKPSSSDNPTMLTGLKIYELLRDSGIPPGVFNYLTGPGSILVDEMLRSPLLKGVAFTGSRAVGTALAGKSLSYGYTRQFITEMSGKNPAIVAKGADLDAAADGIASAAFGYAGQKCSALSRLYVHESIKEELIAKLIERARNMRIGNPLSKEVYMGPLIGEGAYSKYVDAISKARASARVLYGGNAVKTGLNGFYVEPAIIEAKHDSELVRNELFLPMLTIESFSDLGEAIRLANDTEFGLTAGFYGRGKKDREAFAKGIEAGVVYINRRSSATTGAIVGLHTFVGWKGSSMTGKGTGSKHYLQQFMREQSLSIPG